MEIVVEDRVTFMERHGKVDKKEMWDRIRGDSRIDNEVFFSC